MRLIVKLSVNERRKMALDGRLHRAACSGHESGSVVAVSAF